VLRRGEPVARAFARAAGRLASAVGLARRFVPYSIGQTRVIARKPG